MKRIDVLLLRSYIGPFVATFVLSMFLFLMQFLWKYIDDLVGKGINFGILVELIFYSLADLVPMALPLTVMVAGLMTFGNLSENFSLVAMKANGISLLRILRPIFILMIILTGVNFYFMNYVIPKAHLEATALLWDLRQKKPAFNIDEGVFYQQIEGFVLRIGRKDKDNEHVSDVLVYEYKKDDSKRLNVMRAESGLMRTSADKRYLYFTLYNGVRYDEMTGMTNYKLTAPFNMMKFKTQFLKIDLSSLDLKFTEREAYKGDYKIMNIYQLQKELDTFAVKERKTRADSRFFLSKYIHLPGLYQQEYMKVIDSAAVDTVIRSLVKGDILSNYDASFAPNIVTSAINHARGIKGTVDGYVSNFKLNYEEMAPYKVEWHKKFSLSVIVLLLFLISAPLGAIIKKGGIGMPLVVSVMMFVLFYAINLVGEKIGKEGVVPVWAGMWLSSMVLFPLGIWITYKAMRDSPVIAVDRIKSFVANLASMLYDKFAGIKSAVKSKKLSKEQPRGTK